MGLSNVHRRTVLRAVLQPVLLPVFVSGRLKLEFGASAGGVGARDPGGGGFGGERGDAGGVPLPEARQEKKRLPKPGIEPGTFRSSV